MANKDLTPSFQSVTNLTSAATANAATLNVVSTADFPSAGRLRAVTSAAKCRIVYTGKTSISFTGCTWDFQGGSSVNLLSNTQLVGTDLFPTIPDGSLNATQADIIDATTPIYDELATKMGTFTADPPMYFEDTTLKVDATGFATTANVATAKSEAITSAAGYTDAAVAGKVDKLSPLTTPGTKTKITYNTQGQVTAGTDATTADIADSTNKRYVTDAQLVVIGNTSGTNTGDQDLSGLVPKTTTVNGHALSSNVTVTKGDVGLGNADNTSDANKPISTATQTALDLKAPLASPTLTGDPKAPTPTAGDNDTSIATTAFVGTAVANAIAGLPSSPVTSVFGRTGIVVAANGDYNTSQVTENTNLYYTQARFNSALAAKSTTDVAEGTNLYYTAGRFNTAFGGQSTTDLAEGTNQYFTAARVLATVLTGLSLVAGTAVTAADSILVAIGKLQKQITNLAATVPAIVAWFKTGGSQTTPSKIWMDTVAVTSASGFSVDISSAGFSTILGYQVVAIKNTATVTSCPNVSVKSISTSAIVLNFVEFNSSLVSVLGFNVLQGVPVLFANTTGLSVQLIVWGV